MESSSNGLSSVETGTPSTHFSAFLYAGVCSNSIIQLTDCDSYGTTFKALSELYPKRCILDIELQGVLQLKEKAPLQSPPLSPVFLFLSPPTVAELKTRLRGRGTETDDSIRKRLDAARKELEYAVDPNGGHDIVIVNEDLAVAGEKLEKVAMGFEGWETCGDELPAFEMKHLD
jgi:guanylate kinase